MDATNTHDMHLTVTHIDAGGTIQTIIRVGDRVVASYMPGTRHQDRAQETAERVIAEVLRPLFTEAINNDPYAHEVPPDYSDILANEYDSYLDDYER